MFEENEEALEIWASSFTQMRTGFGGPTGLDFVAVDKVAEWLGIEMDDTILRKLRILETDYLNQYYGVSKKEKACRNIEVCSMCNKRCSDRVTLQ